jgi:hypothetical protein
MPRNEGRIKVDIWSDEDFLALPERAQLLYFFLLSQPDINWAGVVTLAARRWAGKLRRSPDEITTALETLETARFVVIDWDTEELLVRTLLRHGGMQAVPNMWKHALTMAERVTSPRIRVVLDTEIARVAWRGVNPSANGSPNPSPMSCYPQPTTTATATATTTTKGEPVVDNSRAPVAGRRQGAGAVRPVLAETPYPPAVEPSARANLAWAFANDQPAGAIEYDVRQDAAKSWPYDPAMREAAVSAWLSNVVSDVEPF